MDRKEISEILNNNKDNIINMRKSCVQLKDIAAKYGLKPSTVSSFLSKNGIRLRNPIPKDEEKVICSRYENGEPMHKIAKDYHVDYSKIKIILQNNNIRIKDAADRRKYGVNEKFFDSIDNQDKAYILGFFYADGNNYFDRYTISMSLQKGDREILEKINTCMENENPLTLIDYENKKTSDGWNRQNQYVLKINNKHMSTRLCELGMIPNKSLVLSYPSVIPDVLARHFIRGYFDGDGSIPKGSQRKVCFTGCLYLLKGIEAVIKKELGFNLHFYNYKHKSPVTYNAMIYDNKNVKLFLDWIYEDANLYLKRKYDIYKNLYPENGILSFAS